MMELNAIELELLAKVRQAEILASACGGAPSEGGFGMRLSRLFRR